MGNEVNEFRDANGRPKKKRRRNKNRVSPVQTLFNTCKEVFRFSRTGFVPPPSDVDRLRSILDSLKPSDVGIAPEMRYFRSNGIHPSPVITYLHIYECDKFSIGIFCLPPCAILPLHNHPGMTVFSKLLMGSMHIKSYDWVGVAEESGGGRRLARVRVDDDFHSPCGTSILYPDSGGNMHRFSALTACAVLDVLGPPYSDPDGRHCNYYLEFPFVAPSDGVAVEDGESEIRAWLEEREKPEDLVVVGAPYTGPKVVESSSS